MEQRNAIKLFDGRRVRALWDGEAEKWLFSIIDVIGVLTDSVDPGAYWRKLKERLLKEGNETVTNCHSLKMLAADGKMRNTDVVDTEQLFRLIQSLFRHQRFRTKSRHRKTRQYDSGQHKA